jgi:hypothetical protein
MVAKDESRHYYGRLLQEELVAMGQRYGAIDINPELPHPVVIWGRNIY